MSSAPVKKWFVNEEGDITDGDVLIAEPNYLTSVSYKTAHLLAAAPELLAACEKAKEFLAVVSHNKSGTVQDANKVLTALVEAIVKAKGERHGV